MSGPKKGDVQLKLNRALDISGKYVQASWDNNNKLNEANLDAVDSARNNAASKCNNADAEVRNSFGEGETLRTEAESLKNQAETRHREAIRRTNELKINVAQLEQAMSGKNHYLKAEDKQAQGYIREAQNIENDEQRAVDLLRQSSSRLENAKTAFEQAVIITEQKEEARRLFEMHRIATANALQSVKNEVASFGEAFLIEWAADENLLQKAKQTLCDAEGTLIAEQFEQSQKLVEAATKLFRSLYEKAVDNQKRVETRNVVKNAIVKTLEDLSYDKPAVGFRAKEGDVQTNRKLWDVEIHANTASGVGNMQLKIDLDGNVDILVDNVPEGKEQECHNRMIELQKNMATIVNFNITDWGRAAHVNPEESVASSNAGKTRIQQTETIKIRQRS